MKITLDQVSAETTNALITQARASGHSVDDYLKRLLGVTNSIPQIASGSIEEFMQAMESLAEDGIEPLPRDFSREDIYFP